MTCTVILGTQWGDEGKGKITDLISQGYDAVVRYQGGNNAGHTIVVEDRTFKLHIIPSGVLHEGKISIIGDGCVVDPWVLVNELDGLEKGGLPIENVLLSDRAHMIMPYHRFLDGIQERARKDGKKVGTTGRGIGPCYEDKARRQGVRVGDLRYPGLVEERVKEGVLNARHTASRFDLECDLDPHTIIKDLGGLGEKILPRVHDTSNLLGEMLAGGKRILLEGAQGVFLDIDRGTYPFVTSSSVTSGYGSPGSGIGPLNIEKVVGVVKAYTTRVGEGPFPTEQDGEIGEILRKVGHEFGTTTERPRRCGWLDMVMLRSSVRWNSVTHIALTKLDVLNSIHPLMVCTGYRLSEEAAQRHGLPTTLKYFPSHTEVLSDVQPEYMAMQGWDEMTDDDWRAVGENGEMPKPLLDYIDMIEMETGAIVALLSYGPARSQTIIIDESIL